LDQNNLINNLFQPLVLVKTRYVDNGEEEGFFFKHEIDAVQELYPKRFDYIKQEDLIEIYNRYVFNLDDGLQVGIQSILHHILNFYKVRKTFILITKNS